MITIVAKLTAVEGKADELRAVLTEMVGNVKAKEQGKALAYSLHTTDADPNTFMFYEQYADAAAVEAHKQDRTHGGDGGQAPRADGQPPRYRALQPDRQRWLRQPTA